MNFGSIKGIWGHFRAESSGSKKGICEIVCNYHEISSGFSSKLMLMEEPHTTPINELGRCGLGLKPPFNLFLHLRLDAALLFIAFLLTFQVLSSSACENCHF